MSVILVAAVCLCALFMALQATQDDCSHPPMQEVVPEKAHGYIRSVAAPSMYDCAAECKLSPLCLSFIFDPEKQTCQRLTEKRAKPHSSFTVGSGVVFSNIHDWKMPLTGACADASCGTNTRCTLGRNDQPVCEIYDVTEVCDQIERSPLPSLKSCNKAVGNHPKYTLEVECRCCMTSNRPCELACRHQYIGMNCTRDDDCRVMMTSCYHGRCLCHPGYSYNITSNSCDRDCKRYANTMTLYKGLGIKGHNRKRMRFYRGFKETMKTCMKACMQETSFNCKTADIMPYHGCYLSSEGYLDASARERERRQRKWWMAVRRCQ